MRLGKRYNAARNYLLIRLTLTSILLTNQIRARSDFTENLLSQLVLYQEKKQIARGNWIELKPLNQN